MPKELKTLSSDTKRLLQGWESFEVDFKRNHKIDSEDLVAFANSENGGTILCGVDEVKEKDGTKKPEVVGCHVGDQHLGSITSKAATCYPSIDVRITIENKNKNPIIRIDVPSGEHKPYCTGGGTYKIREDGNNKALLPPNLLKMYVEKEGKKFIDSFKEATNDLTTNLEKLHDSLGFSFELLEDKIKGFERDMGGTIDDTYGMADESHSYSQDTNSMVYRIAESIDEMKNELNFLSEKVTNDE